MSRADSPLRKHVDHFRQVLMEYCGTTDYAGLRYFPLGSCSNASILLGEYLADSGFGRWRYACGRRESDGYSHAWIFLGATLIDITASQFEEVHDDVWMTTTNSPWHSVFAQSSPPREAAIAIWDDRTQETLRAIYVDLWAILNLGQA